jgi:cytochrome c556
MIYFHFRFVFVTFIVFGSPGTYPVEFPIHSSGDAVMVRKFGAVLAGLVVIVVCLSVDAADEKTPTTKQVMKTVAGKEGLCAKCNAAGKDAKWEDAQKYAKQLSECCANLPKNKCPKGDAESWEKLSKQYAEQAAAINKAASDKDAEKFGQAIKTFTTACKTCHDAHK